jgi:hypothetical protein
MTAPIQAAPRIGYKQYNQPYTTTRLTAVSKVYFCGPNFGQTNLCMDPVAPVVVVIPIVLTGHRRDWFRGSASKNRGLVLDRLCRCVAARINCIAVHRMP